MSRKTAIVLVAFGLLLAGVVTVKLADWKKAKNADKYLPMLNAVEDAYGIPRDLLARQAYQESHFRDDIVNGQTISSAGAVGLMQLVPKFYPGVNTLDPHASAVAAAQSLVSYKKQFGTWSLALAAYNAGPGNVKKYNGIPPFAETQAYVSQITSDVGVV